ncbi:Isocitrate dehydrogenase [NAD] regulatory subunit 3, mitochondrial [Vitis vinifera]|uniref:Isocitrate dehydrogenase [NAD] regulatory subunit 3, mitochondrial n=1 Tax=Vitis vinifera TaxID=29760 RepID=A0A438IIV3_VITVI|nr:Isocitrate dehydrogenase [NAD] regulatory subunit 3, mitochondrial [Vitis vinifera]
MKDKEPWVTFQQHANAIFLKRSMDMISASAGNVGNEKIAQQKKANPVALLLSSAMMLRHLQFPSFADRLETAVKTVISEGKYRTKDLGGTSTTQEVVDAVIAALD